MNAPAFESYAALQIEEFTQDPEWPHEVVQISTGPLTYDLKLVTVGGTMLEAVSCKAAMHVMDTHLGPYVSFGFTTHGDMATRFLADDLDESDAIVWRTGSGVSSQFTTPTNMRGILIRVPVATTEALGWCQNLPARLRSKAPYYRALCRYAVSLLSRPETRTPRAEATLIDLIEAAFGSQLFSSIDRHEQDATPLPVRTVNRALAHLFEPDPDPVGRVDEICREIGVSRRSLYRAFRQTLGVGPASYSRLVRQNEVRSALIMASTKTGSVTQIAHDHGFFHPARFSREYQSLFGEKPSQTLRRAADS